MGDGGAEERVQAAGTEKVLMAFKALGQDHISLVSVSNGGDSLS